MFDSSARHARLMSLPKSALLALWEREHANHHWSVYPVATWRKEEIVNSIIDCERNHHATP